MKFLPNVKITFRPKLKKLVITLAILAAAAGAVVAAAVLVQRNSGKVDVYPVYDLTTGADWVTDTQIEGIVTTDENQSVYISSTEQVTEVYVVKGQAVKAGDPILAFDTTLTDLELDRQRIKVEQLKLDIRDAEEELRVIGTLRPGSGGGFYIPSMPSVDPGTSEPPPDEGTPGISSLPYEITQDALGTRDDPFVYLWSDDCLFSQSFFQKLASTAAERREAIGQEEEGEPDDAPAPEQPAGENVYVIFEVRRSNAVNGELLRSWEMELTPGSGGEWSFRVMEPVYSGAEEDAAASVSGQGEIAAREVYGAYINIGAGYTSAEIAQMRQDCTKRIKELGQELKMAELTYQSLEYEISNGVVVSKLDGVVAELIDADEARLESKPMVVIFGGGGFYVTAALGEMDLSTLAVGDAVTVQSWENYGVIDGRITEISEYPDESGQFWYYSNGNRNVSLYPFKVYVDASTGLREGEYVTVSPVGKSGGSGALFLDMSFVRQESGKSYVYAVGEDGRLERRTVKTGRNLWGSYVEILDGLTQEESIAFPYGRKTRNGAKVHYAEIQQLYETMYY